MMENNMEECKTTGSLGVEQSSEHDFEVAGGKPSISVMMGGNHSICYGTSEYKICRNCGVGVTEHKEELVKLF